MGLLDKLKPQPRWKHSDPAVRLQAIAELDDPGELAGLAEHDLDATVRRAALAKVDDPAVPGRVIAGDADPGVRDAAADRLLALALDAPPAAAVVAAGLLSDVRRLAAIAKSAAVDAVREAALAKLTDERALGSVARHAKDERTALAAASRLTSRDELLSTALNGDHRDVALAAFDRLVGRASAPEAALLETVAARTQQKAVARRAKVMLQAIEEVEAARRAAEDERRKQEAALCAAVEELAKATDPDRAASDLARITAAFEALGPDGATAGRFAAGAEAARARIARRRDEVEAERAAARRRDDALASRQALCRRVDALDGDDVLERLCALEAEWAALPPLVGYEAEGDELAARFARAAAACRERQARDLASRAAHATLEALVVEAEALLDEPGEAADARWKTLSRDARALVATLAEGSQPASDLTDRLGVVARTFEARAAAARAAAEQARHERLAKLERLVVRGERAAASETIGLREGERLLRDLGAALDEVGTGPTAKELREAVAALRTLQERLSPRVKELREMDDWRRFANVQQQEELIAMAEAIVASLKAEEEAGTDGDLAATAKALRELHVRWREVAAVPQHTGRRLWDRFKTATDFIRSRCEVYYAAQRRERAASLAAKAALVEQAEALATSTDWAKTAPRFQDLQKAWEEAGPVPRDADRALARRFRAACNAFFTGRRGALASQKKEWDENLARKEALCERAEQLAASTDWDATASELKKLQAEWKTIGPVGHKQREIVWNRFRSAADGFFERYHDRHKIAAAEQVAEHAAQVTALEGLAALDEAPAELADQVQSLRTTFASLPRVESAEMTALHGRWRAALAALGGRWPAAFAGTDLDSTAVTARLEKLLAKVERLLAEGEPAAAAPASDTASLAERLRAALAQNAMGVRPDESRWRAARKTVEDAQDAWRRIVLVPSDETRALQARFDAASARVMEQVKRHVRLPEGFDETPRGHGRRDRPGRGGRPAGQRPPRSPDPDAPRAGRPRNAKSR